MCPWPLSLRLLLFPHPSLCSAHVESSAVLPGQLYYLATINLAPSRQLFMDQVGRANGSPDQPRNTAERSSVGTRRQETRSLLSGTPLPQL